MKTISGIRKTFIAIAAMALATGVVFASGVILNSLQVGQTVGVVDIALEDPLLVWSLGQAFTMVVNVSNPTNAVYSVHLNLTAGCPTSGIATLTGGQMVTTGDACAPSSQETVTRNIAAGGFQLFSFFVTYTGATGNYVWTIEAHF